MDREAFSAPVRRITPRSLGPIHGSPPLTQLKSLPALTSRAVHGDTLPGRLGPVRSRDGQGNREASCLNKTTTRARIHRDLNQRVWSLLWHWIRHRLAGLMTPPGDRARFRRALTVGAVLLFYFICGLLFGILRVSSLWAYALVLFVGAGAGVHAARRNRHGTTRRR